MEDHIKVATEIGDRSPSTNPVGATKEETKSNLLKLFNQTRGEIRLNTLKQRYEEATGFDEAFDGLLSHLSATMTTLEASEEEDTQTYDQAARLFTYLNSDQGKTEYAQLRWDDISGRCSEEELEKLIEVEAIVLANLELLEKTKNLSEEGNIKITQMLAERSGIPA